MNISYTGKRSQPVKKNPHIARQRGFFSIGIGLGLSALFVLFGTVLEPAQKASTANDPVVVEEVATKSQSILLLSDANSGQHQF